MSTIEECKFNHLIDAVIASHCSHRLLNWLLYPNLRIPFIAAAPRTFHLIALILSESSLMQLSKCVDDHRDKPDSIMYLINEENREDLMNSKYTSIIEKVRQIRHRDLAHLDARSRERTNFYKTLCLLHSDTEKLVDKIVEIIDKEIARKNIKTKINHSLKHYLQIESKHLRNEAQQLIKVFESLKSLEHEKLVQTYFQQKIKERKN